MRPITACRFDREKARGMRLDIAAGTAVRFEPGQSREVKLVPLSGSAHGVRLPAKDHGQTADERTRRDLPPAASIARDERAQRRRRPAIRELRRMVGGLALKLVHAMRGARSWADLKERADGADLRLAAASCSRNRASSRPSRATTRPSRPIELLAISLIARRNTRIRSRAGRRLSRRLHRRTPCAPSASATAACRLPIIQPKERR